MATDRERAHAHYMKNREAIKARVRAYAAERKAEISAYGKVYRAANKEALRSRSKAYYEAHREERISYQKALHAGKKDIVKAYKQQWWERGRQGHLAKKQAHYDKNKTSISEKLKKSYAVDPSAFKERVARRRALKLSTQVETVDLMQVLKASNGLCGICGKALDLFGIDFDHIIPLSRGGTHTYDNLQASHARCNRSKGSKVG